MQLIPGITPIDAAHVDYAQGILRGIGPAGELVNRLPYDALGASERAAAGRYANDLVVRMKALGGPEEAFADVLMVAVRYDRASSNAWNDGALHAALVPALRSFAAHDMWHAVLRLCRLVGFISFHAAHDDAHVQSILSAIEDGLAPELAHWPKPVRATKRPSPNRLSVAIVTDFRLADLSGVLLLMRFLDAYHRRFPGRDRFHLVIEQSAITDASAAHRARIEAAGVAIVTYDQDASDPRTPVGFGNLASVCDRLELDVAVFYCSYCFALLAAWCRLAPLQAFWSVSFDAAPSRQIDLLLSSSADIGGDLAKTVGARRWSVVPPPYDLELRALQPVRRDGPYSQYGRPLFATVGACTKIDNDDFMIVLKRLLELFPDGAFLWTDGTGYPHFPARLQRFGLAHRCHNVGALDIADFAPEIDVHLDGFPYGTAEAALRMLGSGCPTVGMAVKESLYGYVYNPLLANGFGDPELRARARALFLPPGETSRLLVAQTVEHYVELAAHVARDPAYRAACTVAYHSVFSELLHDGAYSAEAWRRALVAALDHAPAGAAISPGCPAPPSGA